MKNFFHLLKHDFILLSRNNIILVAVLVTAIYTGVFNWLSSVESAGKILVLVIFNDPALIGFLFGGVMVLFEKNENTLQALAVTPVTKGLYILSKSVALTIVATVCTFAMAIAGAGKDFSYFHYGMAAVLTTMMFSFIGFMVVAGEDSFNRYILKVIGLLIFLSVPFLGYFGITPAFWYFWIPTRPAIDLFEASLTNTGSPGTFIYAYAALFFWNAVTFYLSRKLIIKSFIS